MDRIMDDAPVINGLDAAYEEFPHVPPGFLDRRSGPVDILIRQDNSHLLAYGGEGEASYPLIGDHDPPGQ